MDTESVLRRYPIFYQLNGQSLAEENKDIEIERLNTTCMDLNKKVALVDDLVRDNGILKNRLRESEEEREIQKQTIEYLEKSLDA